MSFKDFLSEALAAFLSVELNHFFNFERGHHGEHSVKSYEIWICGSGGDVI